MIIYRNSTYLRLLGWMWRACMYMDVLYSGEKWQPAASSSLRYIVFLLSYLALQIETRDLNSGAQLHDRRRQVSLLVLGAPSMGHSITGILPSCRLCLLHAELPKCLPTHTSTRHDWCDEHGRHAARSPPGMFGTAAQATASKGVFFFLNETGRRAAYYIKEKEPR